MALRYDSRLDRFVDDSPAAQPQAAPAGTRGRGGFLTSLISEGGAAGGAALGTAILPGVGTILGAGIGGFLGRIGENKVRDNRYGVGDAAKEGALSAALTGAGQAFKAVKGARAAGKALQAGEGAAAATTRSGIERAGQSALGNAWGIRSGETLGGRVLTPQKVGKLQSFVIDELKVPKTANADQVLEYAANHQSKVGQALKGVTESATGNVDKKSLVTALQGRFSKVLGSGGASNPVAEDILKQVRSAKTPADLWAVRQNVDDLINFAAKDASAVPGAQNIARGARNEINKELQRVVPGFKDLSRSYSSASNVIDLAGKAAKSPKGIKAPGFLGGIGGPQTQKVRSAIGQGALKVGSAQQGLVEALSKPTIKGASSGLAGSLMGAPLRQSPGENTDQMTTSAMNQSNMSMPELSGSPVDASMGAVDNSPYGKANLLYDLQRDPANAAKYISYYQSLQDVFGAGASKPLNSTAAGIVTDLQNGIANIQQLSTDFAQSNVNNPVIGALRGKLPFDTGAQTLQANIARVKQVIGKALEGGVLRKEDEVKYAKILPTLNDTDAVAQNKIQAIADDLQRKLYLYQQNLGQGGGGSLIDSLIGQGGA